MRQTNFSDPIENRACITISHTVYDKRALTTTDPVSLSVSLGNLNHLSTWYPNRISVLLEKNGGIELLVSRLKELYRTENIRSHLGFSCGLSCLSNLASSCGPRIRFRLVQAKVIPLILPVLDRACRNLKLSKNSTLCTNYTTQFDSDLPTTEHIGLIESDSTIFLPTRTNQGFSYAHPIQQYTPSDEKVKVHDLLMCVTIIAYVSKYEATRNILHQHVPLYTLVEQLTSPSIVPELRKWAITCMRNSVRNSVNIKSKRCGFINCDLGRDHFEDDLMCQRCMVVSYCRY
jgi:predicted double-glycine peptidase